MSGGVGGVGGSAGGAGAIGPTAAGAAGAQAVTPAAGAADTGDFNGGEGTTVKSVGGSGESSGESSPHAMALGQGGNQMNTQNFVSLHNQSVQQVSECQEGNMDMRKLIELIMVIKLLEEMNKSQ